MLPLTIFVLYTLFNCVLTMRCYYIAEINTKSNNCPLLFMGLIYYVVFVESWPFVYILAYFQK